MARWVAGSFVVAAVLAVSSFASAEKSESKTEKPEGTKAEGKVRRDPKGVTGISPFMEAIFKGDRAYVARDFEGAMAAYTEAIKLESANAIGHYRQASVYLKQEKHREAEEAAISGLRFAFKLDPIRLKLLYLLADARERQRQIGGAMQGWREYQKLYDEQKAALQEEAEKSKKPVTPPKGFPQTAEERLAKLGAYEQLAAACVKVKQRIDERLAEAAKNAAK